MTRFAVPTPTGDGLLILLDDGARVRATVACERVRGPQGERVIEHLRDAANRSHGRLVADLSRCAAVELDAVRALMALDERCAALGGRLVVLNIPGDVKPMLRAIGADRKLCTTKCERHADRLVQTRASDRDGWLRRLLPAALRPTRAA